MRAPFAPPRLSEPRNVDADAHAVATSCAVPSPESRDARLQRSDVLIVDQCVIDGRQRILPDQLLGGHLGAEVARARAQVAVRELEPGAGKSVGELVGVLVEAARDLFVRRIEAQREIGGQHAGRLFDLRLAVGVRHGARARVAFGCH